MTHCYFTCGSGKAVMRRRPVCAAGRVLAIEAAAPHTPNRRSQVTMLRLPPGCGDEPQPAWLAREQHGRRLRGDWPSGRCRAAESPRLGRVGSINRLGLVRERQDVIDVASLVAGIALAQQGRQDQHVRARPTLFAGEGERPRVGLTKRIWHARHFGVDGTEGLACIGRRVVLEPVGGVGEPVPPMRT